MSHTPRICVFCSIERRYEPIYRTVRKRFPDATVVAMLRHGVLLAEDERSLVDEVRELDLASFSVTRAGGLLRMVNMMRNEHFDELIVLFDSLKLRILCAFSGATRCAVWKEDGRMVIVPTSFARSMSQVARLRAIGAWKVAKVWLGSRLFPVRPRHVP